MADTLVTALSRATARLRDAGADSPRLDAEVLLRHILGWDRARLFARMPDPFPVDVRERYERAIARRAAGEPVAYIVGTREFMGVPFAVGPGVLVPRPETEELVERVAAWARGVNDRLPAPRIVDVGTGSGAIALALARELPAARVVGVERSVAALAYARANRDSLDLAAHVGLVRGDLLSPIGAAEVIAANLPYLRPDQLHAGIAHEPAEALVSGADGLDLYRALLPQAARLLRPPAFLIAEIDPDQAVTMAAVCREAFPGARVGIARDLAGRERFATVNLD